MLHPPTLVKALMYREFRGRADSLASGLGVKPFFNREIMASALLFTLLKDAERKK